MRMEFWRWSFGDLSFDQRVVSEFHRKLQIRESGQSSVPGFPRISPQNARICPALYFSSEKTATKMTTQVMAGVNFGTLYHGRAEKFPSSWQSSGCNALALIVPYSTLFVFCICAVFVSYYTTLQYIGILTVHCHLLVLENVDIVCSAMH